jgi:hypothetical protein
MSGKLARLGQTSVVRFRIRLGGEEHIFDAWLARCPRQLLRHSGRIIFQKNKLVERKTEGRRRGGMAAHSLGVNSLGLIQPSQSHVVAHQITELDRIVGVEACAFQHFAERPVVLLKRGQVGCQVQGRDVIARISFLPKLARLNRLHQVARGQGVVQTLDSKLLPLAHAVAQGVGLLEILGGQACFSEIDVSYAQRGVSHGEIGIKLYGKLIERDGCRIISALLCRSPPGISLQGFERRCGGLFERSAELADGAQGFSQLAADF